MRLSELWPCCWAAASPASRRGPAVHTGQAGSSLGSGGSRFLWAGSPHVGGPTLGPEGPRNPGGVLVRMYLLPRGQAEAQSGIECRRRISEAALATRAPRVCEGERHRDALQTGKEVLVQLLGQTASGQSLLGQQKRKMRKTQASWPQPGSRASEAREWRGEA